MTGSSGKRPQDSDLLLPFEVSALSKEYLEYYKIRRNNFFASVQQFPVMWKYFMLLDSVWLREIEDLYTATDASRMFPLLLYINAHANVRLAIELAFSGCLAEARSLLRDAIEFIAHAHYMLSDPKLQKIWLCKNDGKPDLDAFRRAFEHNKKVNIFGGLSELHAAWCDLSETGSHSNINALADRLEILDTATHRHYKIRYTGASPDFWEKTVFLLLQYCALLEALFFQDYESRLNLDIKLVGMRAAAAQIWVNVCRGLVSKYNLKPPTTNVIPRP